MTVDDFKECIYFNEPSFEYHGKEYSICHPEDKFYVLAEDRPEDEDLAFNTVDDLLDYWMIQGQPLREILSQINM